MVSVGGIKIFCIFANLLAVMKCRGCWVTEILKYACHTECGGEDSDAKRRHDFYKSFLVVDSFKIEYKMYSLTGVLVEVLEGKSGVNQAGKSWSFKDAVVEYQEISNGQSYPKRVSLKFWNKELAIPVGTPVDVTFKLDPNFYNGHYYVNLVALSINPAGQQQAYAPGAVYQQPQNPYAPQYQQPQYPQYPQQQQYQPQNRVGFAAPQPTAQAPQVQVGNSGAPIAHVPQTVAQPQPEDQKYTDDLPF